MKERTTPHHDAQQGLREDTEAALQAQSGKEFYPVSPLLRALDHMLVKTKRIAKVLGIARPLVSMMLAGRRPCPQKYEAKLLMLLQNAIVLGKKTCDDAASGTFMWGDRTFPSSAIKFMRKRIAEAEDVYRAQEKGN